MRASTIGVAMALACAGPHPARAQGANYVDAVSRQILLLNQGGVAEYPDAVSRLVLVVNAGPAVDWRDAVSRQVVLVNAGNGYEVGDVLQALRLAGGMLPVSPGSLGRLDPVKDGGSGGRVDVRDAARIARIVMGLAPEFAGHGGELALALQRDAAGEVASTAGPRARDRPLERPGQLVPDPGMGKASQGERSIEAQVHP